MKEVAGEQVLFVRLGGDRYAYRPPCPAAASRSTARALRGAELTCAGCGHRFDVDARRRCLDQPQLQLEPVPLLVDDAGS